MRAVTCTDAALEVVVRAAQSVVLGHEFCGEVLDQGPKTRGAPAPGARVVAFPLLRAGGAVHPTGLSASAPGGYAEQVLVEASLSFAVPDGLSTDVAALTEPMAVGLHAVRRSQIKKGQVAIVIGPETHAKILIDPSSADREPQEVPRG